ncbi:hypothetical protein L3X38_022818 [Prunus dulcis]|uniref:HXXXD-type acyl-transferase family protein n=1 Tax=Prunus dulcis TaxID=3755 RepID=A0AAD4VYC7_PRUDU|nr:hypothetical protein L3X38_022818 [Prunus dulcis]
MHCRLAKKFGWESSGFFSTSVIDLKDLVAKIKGELEEIKERCATDVVFDSNKQWKKMNEYMNMVKIDDIDKYVCSSWCRFPFYEADFGWGKPSWKTWPYLKAMRSGLHIASLNPRATY